MFLFQVWTKLTELSEFEIPFIVEPSAIRRLCDRREQMDAPPGEACKSERSEHFVFRAGRCDNWISEEWSEAGARQAIA